MKNIEVQLTLYKSNILIQYCELNLWRKNCSLLIYFSINNCKNTMLHYPNSERQNEQSMSLDFHDKYSYISKKKYAVPILLLSE